MQSVYLYGPRDLRLVEQEPEALGPREVRVAITCSGICGTDIHLYQGMVFGAPLSGPAPLGHEYAGRVVEVGAAVTDLRPGDRITSVPNAPCGHCALCRAGRASMCRQLIRPRRGAWAPELVVPVENCWRLPDDVPDRLAALTEPLACAVRAVDRADLRSGDQVVIIGGGPIGLLVLAVARASGARRVILSEPAAYRRDLAIRLGADRVVDPTRENLAAIVRDDTDDLGAPVAFEAVGQPATIEQAISCAAPGGTVVIVGVADRDARASFNPQELFFKELTIRGTKGIAYAVDRALGWLTRLDLDPLITHEFPLAEAQAAIDLSVRGQTGKVLLYP